MPSCNKGFTLYQSKYKLNIAAKLQCRSTVYTAKHFKQRSEEI